MEPAKEVDKKSIKATVRSAKESAWLIMDMRTEDIGMSEKVPARSGKVNTENAALVAVAKCNAPWFSPKA
jgi:hypothetical protein